MNKIKSDIEIARASKMKPIGDVLGKFNIPDDPFSFSPMGSHIAKLNFKGASLEMLNSRWAKQTPSRAKYLSDKMSQV